VSLRLAMRAAVFVLALAALASGCGPDTAQEYDVLIAICHERLQSTDDFCERISESSGAVVYANVLFGRASGHRVTVVTEVTSGGSRIDEQPSSVVPPNRSWLHTVEIPRSSACLASSCELRVHAVVDGERVVAEDFAFTSD
jgi:hypothetical protein